MNRVVLVHGMKKGPGDVWYPFIKREVEGRGMVCEVPDMGQSQNPLLNEWLTIIDAQRPDDKTVLVGHSRGGMAILRWLETRDVHVGRVILVAANSATIQDEANGDFYCGPYNFEKITRNCDDFVLMYSKDDKWIPYEAGLQNQAGLNGKLLTFEEKGHFGTQGDGSVLLEFPELLEEIMR